MKYGRLPRVFHPEVPHFSAMKFMRSIQRPILPVDCHAKLPANLGYMLNDKLGNCTIAGLGHAEQLWTQFAQNNMITIPDACVLQGYEEACKYNPADLQADGSNPTDNGGVEQEVLSWATTIGVPQADNSRNKLLGFIEIDPHNSQNLCEAIYECGVVYIGFEVPQNLPEDAGSTWFGDMGPTEGGHCVLLTGFQNPASPIYDVISWGLPFTADQAFISKYCDEAYGLMSEQWITVAGKSPWGFDIPTIQSMMQAVKAS